MICVNCGRWSKETPLVNIDALCPQLKACLNCVAKFPGNKWGEDRAEPKALTDEAHRQLLYNKHGMFPPMAVECMMCKQKKCLWNSDGSRNIICQDCNARRVNALYRARAIA